MNDKKITKDNGDFSCDAKASFVGDQKQQQEEKTPKTQTALDEQKILEFWKKNDIFKKSIKNREKAKEFVFYDGPPFATGMPHYGHLLPGTVKDIIPRYKTMQGYKVSRNWGWDCHGLPVENLIEKELKLNSKKDIIEYGIGNFNKKAKDSVLRYDSAWKEIIPKTGRWVDMDNPYKTMDSTYTESLWWAFKELEKKGLVEKSFKSMHICPRCETTLSNNEVTDGYKNIKDLSVIAKFQLVDEPKTYILAWTTTPWTLPGNVALAVNEELIYVKAENSEGESLIFAKDLYEKIEEKSGGKLKISKELKGKDLLGRKYIPVFDYYYKKDDLKGKENGWKIYGADFVTATDGTGIVHIAPAFGEDDLKLGQKYSLPFIQHIGMDGRFKEEVTDFAGLQVRKKEFHEESDIEVIKYLAHNGKLFAKEKFEHSYPLCWRCDTPLLNYSTSSWFILTPKIKEKLLSENEKINWVPEHIGSKRFKNWLESTRPWAVSRSRFWGAPLPIWENEKTGEYEILGSLNDLQTKTQSTNKFFTLRHGLSEANVSDNISCTIGEFGDNLTEQGIEDTKKAAKALKKVSDIDLIISSPFIRAKQTAEKVAEIFGIPQSEIIYDDALKERNFGDANGQPNSKYREWLNSEEFAFDKKFENGESHLDVKKRVMDFLYKIDNKYKDKNILIVSHHDPIRFLEIGTRGLGNDKALEFIKTDYVNSQLQELNFAPIPHNDEYVLDYHRPYIDKISWLDENGDKYSFIGEVFDCWFESGSMPYASKHYPFENKDIFDPKKNIGFPADFISESQDQTRGWFNTMLILSTALFDQTSFKNVIVTGMILAEDGKKMSKSLKNYPDISYILNKYGGDAMRLYLMSSPAVQAESLAFSEKGVDEFLKKVILKTKNVLSFYKLYENSLEKELNPKSSSNILDQWIIQRTEELLKTVTDNLEKYQIDLATRSFVDYVDDLSTWYIRRSRDRFKGSDQKDKDYALSTTKYVLTLFAKTIAPFAPFLADELYISLKNTNEEESVHLSEWPKIKKCFFEKIFPKKDLLPVMKEARDLVSIGLEARSVSGFKVRQPLNSILVIAKKEKINSLIKEKKLLEIIKDELNIKEIIFENDLEKAKTKKLEEKFVDLKEFVDDEKKQDDILVFLDKNITPKLKKEGRFRELVRAIQALRKKEGLEVNDDVELKIEVVKGDNEFIEDYQDNLKEHTGIAKISYVKLQDEPEVKINDFIVKINLTKVQE